MQAILGLNLSHNPSAALILDSKLICAFKEEKLRLKVALNGQKFVIDQFNMDAIGTKLLDGLESDFK